MVNRNIKAAPGMDDVFFIYGDPILYFKPYSVFSASLFLLFFCVHKDVLSSYHEIVLNIFPVLFFFLVDTNK